MNILSCITSHANEALNHPFWENMSTRLMQGYTCVRSATHSSFPLTISLIVALGGQHSLILHLREQSPSMKT